MTNNPQPAQSGDPLAKALAAEITDEAFDRLRFHSDVMRAVRLQADASTARRPMHPVIGVLTAVIPALAIILFIGFGKISLVKPDIVGDPANDTTTLPGYGFAVDINSIVDESYGEEMQRLNSDLDRAESFFMQQLNPLIILAERTEAGS